MTNWTILYYHPDEKDNTWETAKMHPKQLKPMLLYIELLKHIKIRNTHELQWFSWTDNTSHVNLKRIIPFYTKKNLHCFLFKHLGNKWDQNLWTKRKIQKNKKQMNSLCVKKQATAGRQYCTLRHIHCLYANNHSLC